MTIICLVACAARKKNAKAKAKDLYDSALFAKSRSFAEKSTDTWYILSAKHGLLSPESVIDPYELTLKNMKLESRRDWATRVIAELDQRIKPGDKVVFLAGKDYREFLQSHLLNRGVLVEVPMEGMRIGEQLAWLTNQD